MTNVNVIFSQIPHLFTTNRTRVEKITNMHTNYLSQIFANPYIKEVYNTGDDESFNNVTSQLAIINNQWEQYGYGLYIIFDKQTSEFIGLTGFHTVTIDEADMIDCFDKNNQAHELELYALLMPTYWQKGYGFEVATNLIELAFTYLHYTSMIAYIEPKNYASTQFIKKLSFIEQRKVTYNNKAHILYRLKKMVKY